MFIYKLKSLKKNHQFVQKLNDAFYCGNREFILSHVSDDIKWNIVGMPAVCGREDFIKVMEIMESAAGGFPGMQIKNIISEGEYIVVESSGSAKNNPGKSYRPSFCEVYRVKDEKIMELTTYIVDAG